MDLAKKLSFLVILVCVLIALKNQRAALRSRSLLEEDSSAARRELEGDEPSPLHSDGGEKERRLTYDFYGSSCPSAEKIVRTTVRELHSLNSSVGPALLRLAFHDCFVNAGGQFYPVLTGRLDSKKAFPDLALGDLPGPDFNITRVVNSFAKKGFNPREMVALLGGGHSTGKIHCDFFRHRLFNFTGKNQPDPSINAEFLEVLRSQCSHPSSPPSQSPSPSPPSSFENRAMKMDYEGAGNGFGEVYYRSLMQGRGLLVSDQQLMARGDTKSWVEAYAADHQQFRRDFGLAMFKLTHIQSPRGGGEVRLSCRKINRNADL